MYTPRRAAAGAVLACPVPLPPGEKTGPPLPGELLADLLALVGEINAVLDPEELFHAIAQKLRRIVDYRILDIFLPDAEGFLAPAHVEGYDLELASRFRVRVGEGIVGAAAACAGARLRARRRPWTRATSRSSPASWPSSRSRS